MISKYNFCSCANLCTLLLINLLILIYTFIFLNISNYTVRENNTISKNWGSTIIQDIKFTRDKCPYQYEPLLLGYTNKVMEGSNCYSTNKVFDYSGESFENLFPYTHYTGEEDTSCNSVSSIPRTPIYSWRNTVICVLKSYYKSYVDITMTLPYRNCPFGYIKCPHPVDTLNEIMCVKNLFECGINDIQVINPADTYDKLKYSKLDFYDGHKSLIFGRLVQNKPTVVDFRITKGKICANPVETSINKNKSYILYESYPFASECQTNINGHYTNPNYKLLDTSNEEEVYTSLDLIGNYYNLPDYPQKFLWDLDYNLYYSTYVGFQNFCKWNPEQIRYFLSNTDLFPNQNGGAIGIIVCAFLIIFFILAIFLSFNCSEGEKKDCHQCGLFFIVLLFFTIFIIAWVYFAYYNSVAFYKYLFDNYENTICFDKFHTGLIEYQNATTSYYPNFYLIIALFTTVMISMLCFVPIFAACMKNEFNWDFSDD